MKRLPSAVSPQEVESRLRRAEDRFQAGRRHYQQGDYAAARNEFDRAIEVLLGAAGDLPERRRLELRYAELVESIYRFDLDRLSAEESSEPAFDVSPLDDILQMTFPIDPNLKVRVKEELLATVSQLPLEVNDSVLSYINYFSSPRGRKTLIAGLQRAGRYRPLIHRILDEEGVPRELLYLAQAESGFLPRAVSRKKATGMWQFMKFRGLEYGLAQTPFTDDRLDPEKATRAAARHLRDLYAQFGDWYLALAAYNCGPGAVDRAVARTGYADFWELRNRRALPRETSNYVPIILALTIMVKNADDYGLQAVEPDPPLEYDTVQVTSATHLSLISDIVGLPLPEIRGMNPAILKDIAPEGYGVRLPKGTASLVVTALESIPRERRASWRMHRVEEGESLALIGKRYKTTVEAISEANHTGSDGPEAGDLLVIPVTRSGRNLTGKPVPAARTTPRPQRKRISRRSKAAPVRSGS